MATTILTKKSNNILVTQQPKVLRISKTSKIVKIDTPAKNLLLTKTNKVIKISGVHAPTAAVDTVFTAACPAATAVGDPVFALGTTIGVDPDVDNVDPTDRDKMPAIGVVVSKSSSVVCTVRFAGVTSAIFSGLSQGFVFATASGITQTVPSAKGDFQQVIGVALSATKILVNIEPMVRL